MKFTNVIFLIDFYRVSLSYKLAILAKQKSNSSKVTSVFNLSNLIQLNITRLTRFFFSRGYFVTYNSLTCFKNTKNYGCNHSTLFR